jgi:hypothetical protein
MNLEDFAKMEKIWTEETYEYLSKLNDLKFIDTNIEFNGYVTTSLVVDGLKIDFDLTYDYDEDNDKPVVKLELSSPSKKGSVSFKISGKNTTPEGIKNFIVKKIFKY